MPDPRSKKLFKRDMPTHAWKTRALCGYNKRDPGVSCKRVGHRPTSRWTTLRYYKGSGKSSKRIHEANSGNMGVAVAAGIPMPDTRSKKLTRRNSQIHAYNKQKSEISQYKFLGNIKLKESLLPLPCKVRTSSMPAHEASLCRLGDRRN